MLDRERVLVKIDQLEGYLKELREIVPEDFATYQRVEKRRACERLLQISIEAVIDICHLLVAGLRLGIPAEGSRNHIFPDGGDLEGDEGLQEYSSPRICTHR
jgi:uncharacterized protein YutE (UPF0331/DUF86 family)